MNILILYNDKTKGGLVTHTKILAEGLRRRGINVVVVGTDGPGPRTILENMNVDFVDFSCKNPFRIYSKISRVVKDNHIDLIHAQNRVPALYASVVCLLNRRVKYVWANHQVPIPDDFFHRILTKYGAKAITCSIDGFKLLTNNLKIPKKKVSIVNLGVDIDKFTRTTSEEQKKTRKKYGINENEIVILLYGRLTESKGHLFFLRSLALADKAKNYKVIFPGDGSEEYKKEIITFAKENGMEDRLIFPGFVNGRELLSISDLMVLPSKQEGFPIACIEAYCMGVPVIRTKTSGYEDAREFCTGIDYGDVDAFSKEINAFFEGDGKFAKKQKEALRLRERFSTKHMIEQYVKIYQEILDKV